MRVNSANCLEIIPGINAKGRFGKQDFIYVAADDVYLCPAGERLPYRYTIAKATMDFVLPARRSNGLALARSVDLSCRGVRRRTAFLRSGPPPGSEQRFGP